jgi:hypothetical protein
MSFWQGSVNRLIPDPQAQAIRLCKDFRFFAWNCLKIATKSGEIHPFSLNKAQQFIHEALERQMASTGKVRALILKGRQQGASTYTEGRFYWKTALNRGKTAFILTHEDKATQNIFGMARRYHDLMPDEARPSTAAANANELVFDIMQSRYAVGTAGSKGTGRSFTVQYFHGSEVAFWPNARDHLAGIGQAVPNEPGTEVILESTGNGMEMFHGFCQDAMRGKSDYQLIFVPWFWQPEYRIPVPEDFGIDASDAEYAARFGLDSEQMAWRRQKIVDDFRGDVSLFDQEYPATPSHAFRRSSGNPLISPAKVEKARKQQDIEARGARIMGVDPAEYGDDDSAICRRQGRVVSGIRRFSKKGPMELVGLVAKEADEWSPDAINVDCTGVGSGVADRLIELGYPVNRIHFGERAIDDQQYALRRDEMWGEMRKWFDDDPAGIPDDDVLEADLTGPQYTYDSSRRLKLERKEDMKKRGLPSPDSADSLALTFAVRIAPRKDDPHPARKFNWRLGV